MNPMIKKAVVVAASLFFLFLFGACSTYSKQECTNMNWNQIAYEHGYNGDPNLQQIYNRYALTCGKDHDIFPDKGAMEQGYTSGLKQYCTADGGIRAGASGKPYTNVCGPEATTQFMKSYQPARLSWLENDYKRLKAENENLKSQVSDLEGRIHSLEMRNSDLTTQVRTCD